MQTLRKKRKRRKKKKVKVEFGSDEFKEQARQIANKQWNNPLNIIKKLKYHMEMDEDYKKEINERKSRMNKKLYKLNPKPFHPTGKRKLHKRINTYAGVITEKELAEL